MNKNQILLIQLAKLDKTNDYWAELEECLSEPIDWWWILAHAAKHKVLHTVWDTLVRGKKLERAISCTGMHKLITVYMEQLSWINRKRNNLFIDNTENLFEHFDRINLSAVCIKGGSLIGTIYHHGNRMLHDIDIVVAPNDLSRAKEVFETLGYRHGVQDPATGLLSEMPEDKKRFWQFNAHTLPPFYLPTGKEYCKYFKISVGHDFFDPAERFTFPSNTVIESRNLKCMGSAIYSPSANHMFINLCAHIYREGVSASFARNADNWQLIKFCDLRTFLLSPETNIDTEEWLKTVISAGLQKPMFFALFYAHKLYGDASIAHFRDLVDPGDRKFLNQVIEGKRVIDLDRTFEQRLFESSSSLPDQFEPNWGHVFNEHEY